MPKPNPGKFRPMPSYHRAVEELSVVARREVRCVLLPAAAVARKECLHTVGTGKEERLVHRGRLDAAVEGALDSGTDVGAAGLSCDQWESHRQTAVQGDQGHHSFVDPHRARAHEEIENG